MNVLHFGAGNIGKGLILPVLKTAKQVTSFTFVDVDEKMIDYLNEQNEVKINYYSSDKQESIKINDFTAIKAKDLLLEKNLEMLSNIDMITTSVGINNLDKLIELFNKVISINKKNLVFMCCENGFRVSTEFGKKLNDLSGKVSYIDCIIDRIIPNQNFIETKALFAEKYYSWICDEEQWPKEVAKIDGISYTNLFELEINKKLCLVNGLHCAVAWYRFAVDGFKDIRTVSQALSDNPTRNFLINYVQEVSSIFSEFFNVDDENIYKYGIKNIERFLNKKIDDDLARVGRNPITKLSDHERIVTPIRMAMAKNLRCFSIMRTFKNGLNFWLAEDEQGLKMKTKIMDAGVIKLLTDDLKISQEVISQIKAEIM